MAVTRLTTASVLVCMLGVTAMPVGTGVDGAVC
jgi:hypothetical protein